MKKFLSLVLALVMAMSLVTISAGATEFKDLASAEQDYKEAIDVISDLGIVGGVTADTFQPKGTLTRGAATKFVANLMLGPDLAAKLPDGAPFTDVPAGSTFAKYATYLKSQGVVGGYGNGSFGVKNGLTGDAFLKMVLGALGYDAAAEGYGVDGWQVNVALDAIEAGLVTGLKNFDSSKVITREVAAQIVLNALEAKTVRYETNGTISIGNVVISNNSKAEYVANNAYDYDRANAYEGVNVADGYMQLVEKLFPGYEKDEKAVDNFARPAVAWYDEDGDQIVLTVEKPVKIYGTRQNHKTVYAALGLKSTDVATFKYFVNGYPSTGGTLSSTSTTSYVGGNVGGTLEIYYDKTQATPITAIQINEYIGEVVDVTPAEGSNKRYITIDKLEGGSLASSVPGIEYTFETESFEEGDIVTYTFATKEDVRKIQSVELANAKTGKYTQLVGSATPYIDGAKIEKAGTARAFAPATLDVDFGDTIKAYLNSNGYYLYVEKVSENTEKDKYAYVLAATTIEGEADWATGKTAADTFKAQLLFTDGTTEIVETKTSAAAFVYDFVTYGVNSKGQYELADATTGNITAAGAVATVKGAVSATIGEATVVVNNATTFIVKTQEGDKDPVYTLYVGYKAVPTMTGELAFADYIQKTDAKAASYVYIDTTVTKNAEGEVIASGATIDKNAGIDASILLIGKTTNTSSKITTADGSWYNLKALIGGEIVTIKYKADDYASTMKNSVVNRYDGYTIDENGIYTCAGHTFLGNTANGMISYTLEGVGVGVSYADGLLTLGEKNCALADDAIIVYSTGNNNMTLWTVEKLAEYEDVDKADTADVNELDQTWHYVNEAGEVTLLVINKK